MGVLREHEQEVDAGGRPHGKDEEEERGEAEEAEGNRRRQKEAPVITPIRGPRIFYARQFFFLRHLRRILIF